MGAWFSRAIAWVWAMSALFYQFSRQILAYLCTMLKLVCPKPPKTFPKLLRGWKTLPESIRCFPFLRRPKSKVTVFDVFDLGDEIGSGNFGQVESLVGCVTLCKRISKNSTVIKHMNPVYWCNYIILITSTNWICNIIYVFTIHQHTHIYMILYTYTYIRLFYNHLSLCTRYIEM